MKKDAHVRIYRLEDFYREPIWWKEAAFWYRLMWLDDGRGMLFLTAGTDFHLERYQKGGWVVLISSQAYFNFMEAYPQFRDAPLFEINTRQASISTDPGRTFELDHIAESLADLISADRSDLFLQQYVNLLFLHAEQAYAEKYPLKIQGRDASVMHELSNLMNKYYRTKRKTSFYADQLSISTKELNKIASRITGMNVRENINSLKLSKAKALLLTTTASIKEIALELDYLTQGHFSTFFKEKVGCTPGEFRKRAGV